MVQSSERGGGDTSARPEWEPEPRGHLRGKLCHQAPKEAALFLFFVLVFEELSPPLTGAKPADTDGVLQNRAKRQEHKEQSYL